MRLETVFLFPSQIEPMTPAQLAQMTPKPCTDVRVAAHQLLTPVSAPRPQHPPARASNSTEASAPATTVMGPPSSPSRRDDPFRPPATSRTGDKQRLRYRTAPRTPKKGKGRSGENDENVAEPVSSTGAPSATRNPGDYTIYKGRGRYNAQVQYVVLTLRLS